MAETLFESVHRIVVKRISPTYWRAQAFDADDLMVAESDFCADASQAWRVLVGRLS